MMKAVAKFVVVAFLVVILCVASTALSQESTAPRMSVCDVRRTVVKELQNIDVGDSGLKRIPWDIKVSPSSIEFYAELKYVKKNAPRTQLVKLELKGLKQLTIDRMDNDALFLHWHYSSVSVVGVWRAWKYNDDAQQFVNAVNRLIAGARNYDPAKPGFAPPCEEAAQVTFWNEFQQKAAAWRALSRKPPVSDDVRQHRLLAEDAMKEKQMDTAIAEYEAGLEIDPLWPQGHFNAALLYGEQKDYEDAIWHMRAYLELVPDAPDAQAAHDQMTIWEAEISKAGSH
jgi:tetratricopeptide (TPR) repeat protein